MPPQMPSDDPKSPPRRPRLGVSAKGCAGRTPLLPHQSGSDIEILSQGVHVFPWKVLGPGDDNSESINTLKDYCP